MIHDYIFDVDGTLTPSRGSIDPNFYKEFLNFCYSHRVFLVTGSDRDKTIEQIGEEIYNACMMVFNCSGNDIYVRDKNMATNRWELPIDAKQWLNFKLEHSAFPLRTGLHFEDRPGMCNFSVVGRNANPEQRKQYYEYDCKTKEREKISTAFNEKYPDLQSDVGGETGIDIFKKGCNKAQILNEFTSTDRIKFYGDRTDPAGNDYPLAVRLKAHQVYAVEDWKHTMRLLANE